MGKKVHPKIFRILGTQQWNSKWFSKRNFAEYLQQDARIRKFLFEYFKKSSVGKIEIERLVDNIKLIIHAAKPGLIIGRGGQGAEELKNKLQKKFLDKKLKLEITIQEIKNPNLCSQIVLQNLIENIEKRMPYRKTMKQTIEQVKKAGAQGVKVILSGRLDGVEIARRENLFWGKIPLHTLRADIDYARGTAHTTYGTIGAKVWIYKGLKF
ncbi:MAG: ribosomal protein S3 (BS3) [Parcubacteria group bacterium Athens1014_10]|nr:MAG: ribosomal protein S3 (BS3) [Parcubacteria group bacterium Athens1014_10]TSD05493.1 MAG: ribosomal protein S3 (BS3) [Parcubacteria group bacterium Athens0714_12]